MRTRGLARPQSCTVVVRCRCGILCFPSYSGRSSYAFMHSYFRGLYSRKTVEVYIYIFMYVVEQNRVTATATASWRGWSTGERRLLKPLTTGLNALRKQRERVQTCRGIIIQTVARKYTQSAGFGGEGVRVYIRLTTTKKHKKSEYMKRNASSQGI